MITIQQDTIVEGTESFNATLTGTSDVVVNNTAGTATVFIADNDGGKFASYSIVVYNKVSTYLWYILYEAKTFLCRNVEYFPGSSSIFSKVNYKTFPWRNKCNFVLYARQ